MLPYDSTTALGSVITQSSREFFSFSGATWLGCTTGLLHVSQAEAHWCPLALCGLSVGGGVRRGCSRRGLSPRWEAPAVWSWHHSPHLLPFWGQKRRVRFAKSIVQLSWLGLIVISHYAVWRCKVAADRFRWGCYSLMPARGVRCWRNKGRLKQKMDVIRSPLPVKNMARVSWDETEILTGVFGLNRISKSSKSSQIWWGCEMSERGEILHQ